MHLTFSRHYLLNKYVLFRTLSIELNCSHNGLVSCTFCLCWRTL